MDLAAEQERGDKLDATIAAQNQAALDKGLWTQEQYDAAQADASQGSTGDVTSQVTDAAEEGAVEGLQNDVALVKSGAEAVSGAVNSTLSWSLWTVVKAIPVSVWIVAGIVAFFYFGGGALVRAAILKKARE